MTRQDRTLYQWFLGSVERFPGHAAVEIDGAEVSYAKLHALAEALAGEILARHGSAPRRVALLANRSLVAFAGYLAAQRIGAVVTPLNPEFPVRRNAFAGYLDPGHNGGRFVDYDGSGPLTTAHYYRTGDRIALECGERVHLGRLDNQVKVRGYRIELGDIEANLRRHPAIRDAVVVAVRNGEEADLAGYYTGDPVPANELIRWLRGQIPLYMVPRRLTHLAELPLNPNGKIDRPRLHTLSVG